MTAAQAQGPHSSATKAMMLVREKTRQALDATGDRQAARRLMLEWIAEDAALREAIAGDTISAEIAYVLRQQMSVTRRQVIDGARAGIPAANGGGGCLPVPSPAARARAVKTVLRGWYALPLPQSDVRLGEAKANDIRGAYEFHRSRRRANGVREHFYGFLLAALPDKDEPESKQKPVSEWLDEPAIKTIDARAQRAESKRMLRPGGKS